MSGFFYNTMLISFVGTIALLLYIGYDIKYGKDNIDVLFKVSDIKELDNNYATYKRIKSRYISVYIVGLLLGVIIVVLNNTGEDKLKKLVLSPRMSISDVDDIYVK